MESPQSFFREEPAEGPVQKISTDFLSRRKWYICKYGRLTDSIKNVHSNPPTDFEVFFPFFKRVVKNGKTSKTECCPILPGYIFVKGFHDKILADELFRTLPMLRTHTDRSFITVSDRQMNAISRFVQEFQENSSLELETVSLELEMFVVPEEYDYAEIVKGPYKGKRGFFKTRERSKHGTFYFELENIDASTEIQGEEECNEPTSRTMQVVPAIVLHRSFLKIIRFAPNNGHARDFLNKAYNKALAILEKVHNDNYELTPLERETIAGYVICYSDVETDTFKQRTNLLRLLLVCHAILNNEAHFKQILSVIENVVYSDYEVFVEDKRKNKEKEAAKAAYKSYKESVERIVLLKKDERAPEQV